LTDKNSILQWAAKSRGMVVGCQTISLIVWQTFGKISSFNILSVITSLITYQGTFYVLMVLFLAACSEITWM